MSLQILAWHGIEAYSKVGDIAYMMIKIRVAAIGDMSICNILL